MATVIGHDRWRDAQQRRHQTTFISIATGAPRAPDWYVQIVNPPAGISRLDESFLFRRDALTYARDLNRQYGWPIAGDHGPRAA